MDCKAWREMASDYIEGTLDTSAAQAMKRHAVSCASCGADEAALRAISRELNVLPAVEPPLFFRENLISAIERGEAGAKRPVAGSFWQVLFPRLGRVAFGTLAAGGVCAALLWGVLIPRSAQSGHPQIANVVPAAAPLSGLLPGLANPVDEAVATPQEPPHLHIGHVLTVQPEGGPAYDFSLWLENADKGTARFHLLGDKRMYRFTLGSGVAPQTLRVPVAAAQGGDTLNLAVEWMAGGRVHTKYLFVPTPRADDKAPDKRQSFGLPEGTVVDAARQIASRYGTPVTLEDLPATAADESVMVAARDETASETLRRNLADHGLSVSVSGAGVLVTPASGESPVSPN